MMKFERLEGPCGVPVYYQQLPEFVKSTAIALTVFTGSADDTSVGEPGLYHWFEHVPFRGTAKFPTEGYMVNSLKRTGGNINASTSPFRTKYEATLPTRHLSIGLDVVVDLVAQPLLNDEGVFAEREVIKREILQNDSKLERCANNRLREILWKGHPLEHSTLGTEESLDSMTPEILREARRKGYDRSRMAFFISTSLPATEILDMVSDRFDLLPSNGLEERRMSVPYGPLVWTPGDKVTFHTTFQTSRVLALFYLPPNGDLVKEAKRSLVRDAFAYGGPGSPLYRAVRGENQLAYSAGVIYEPTRDGGYGGFSVDTSSNDVDAVLQALRKMFKKKQLRSREWFEHIRESRRCALEMEVISPRRSVDEVVDEIVEIGETTSDENWLDIRESIQHEEIIEMIDRINFDEARIVVALGK